MEQNADEPVLLPAPLLGPLSLCGRFMAVERGSTGTAASMIAFTGQMWASWTRKERPLPAIGCACNGDRRLTKGGGTIEQAETVSVSVVDESAARAQRCCGMGGKKNKESRGKDYWCGGHREWATFRSSEHASASDGCTQIHSGAVWHCTLLYSARRSVPQVWLCTTCAGIPPLTRTASHTGGGRCSRGSRAEQRGRTADADCDWDCNGETTAKRGQ